MSGPSFSLGGSRASETPAHENRPMREWRDVEGMFIARKRKHSSIFFDGWLECHRNLLEPSCSDFCRVCGRNFTACYGDLKQRVSTENFFNLI